MALQQIKALYWGNEEFEEYGNAWMELMPRVRIALNPDQFNEAGRDAKRDAYHRREEAPDQGDLNKLTRNDFWLMIQRVDGQWERARAIWSMTSKAGKTYLKIWSDKFNCSFFVFFPSIRSPFTRQLAATLCKEV